MTAQTGRPLVSVLMPVLNPHPDYFPRAVESILRQTLEEIELIIVEAPSLRSAADFPHILDDPRVRYYRVQEPTSLVAQRNYGLAHAAARLVALLDADDIAEPDRLQKQCAYLHVQDAIEVLGSQVSIMDARGDTIGYRGLPLAHEAILRALPRWPPFCHSSVMFKKEVVLAAGGYRYDRYPALEDYELWSRLAHRGARFANHPERLVHYRIHPEQMKITCLRGIIRGILDIKRTYWHEHMDLAARARMWSEWLMLGLPPRLVLRLFMLSHYQTRAPVQALGAALAGVECESA